MRSYNDDNSNDSLYIYKYHTYYYNHYYTPSYTMKYANVRSSLPECEECVCLSYLSYTFPENKAGASRFIGMSCGYLLSSTADPQDGLSFLHAFRSRRCVRASM